MTLTQLRLDAAPLLALLDARGGAPWILRHPHGGESGRRAYQRIKADGVVSVRIADRLAIRLLGRTLDEVYGPDYDAEVDL